MAESMIDVTVIIINASFHLTYPMAEDRWGTSGEFATRPFRVSLSWAFVC